MSANIVEIIVNSLQFSFLDILSLKTSLFDMKIIFWIVKISINLNIDPSPVSEYHQIVYSVYADSGPGDKGRTKNRMDVCPGMI